MPDDERAGRIRHGLVEDYPDSPQQYPPQQRSKAYTAPPPQTADLANLASILCAKDKLIAELDQIVAVLHDRLAGVCIHRPDNIDLGLEDSVPGELPSQVEHAKIQYEKLIAITARISQIADGLRLT